MDPPADIVISDPGHLGYLDITWSLPTSLTDKTECPKLYQLEYFDTYRDRWNVSANHLILPLLTRLTSWQEFRDFSHPISYPNETMNGCIVMSLLQHDLAGLRHGSVSNYAHLQVHSFLLGYCSNTASKHIGCPLSRIFVSLFCRGLKNPDVWAIIPNKTYVIAVWCVLPRIV